MKMRWQRGTLIAIATLAFVSCGSGNSAGSSKPIGSAGGPCTSGGGCDPGLVCQSQICTSHSDAGAAKADSGNTVSANCATSGLSGMAIPAGTVASASGSYSQSLASNAIDGSLTTPWNSGTYTGWLRLDFPAPVAMTAVHLAVGATPTTNETYTITTDSTTTPIGSSTQQVTAGIPVQLEPISVTPGSYSNITITVKGGSSWVQIMDISLVTSDCPANSVTPVNPGNCDCSTRLCGDDGCGHSCGSCDPGETCVNGDCVS
jgi:hypothetical protein